MIYRQIFRALVEEYVMPRKQILNITLFVIAILCSLVFCVTIHSMIDHSTLIIFLTGVVGFPATLYFILKNCKRIVENPLLEVGCTFLLLGNVCALLGGIFLMIVE